MFLVFFINKDIDFRISRSICGFSYFWDIIRFIIFKCLIYIYISEITQLFTFYRLALYKHTLLKTPLLIYIIHILHIIFYSEGSPCQGKFLKKWIYTNFSMPSSVYLKTAEKAYNSCSVLLITKNRSFHHCIIYSKYLYYFIWKSTKVCTRYIISEVDSQSIPLI